MVKSKTTSSKKQRGTPPPEERQIPIRLSVDESVRKSLDDIAELWNIRLSDIIRNSIQYILNLDVASQRDILFPLNKRKK